MEFTGLADVLPDHALRPVSMDDVPLLYDLVSRINMTDLGRVDTTEAELRDDLGGPHFELEADTLLAIDPAGRAVAYGQGHDERTGVGWVDVYVDHELAAFDDVADAVIAACCARVTESARERGASSVKLTSNLYEVEGRMRSAYERQEFHVETVYWRMGLGFADVAPGIPALSEGYEIRAVDPNDDDVMAQGYELYRDTFSEHHGVGDSDISLDDFSAGWRAQESFDPNFLVVRIPRRRADRDADGRTTVAWSRVMGMCATSASEKTCAGQELREPCCSLPSHTGETRGGPGCSWESTRRM